MMWESNLYMFQIRIFLRKLKHWGEIWKQYTLLLLRTLYLIQVRFCDTERIREHYFYGSVLFNCLKNLIYVNELSEYSIAVNFALWVWTCQFDCRVTASNYFYPPLQKTSSDVTSWQSWFRSSLLTIVKRNMLRELEYLRSWTKFCKQILDIK